MGRAVEPIYREWKLLSQSSAIERQSGVQKEQLDCFNNNPFPVLLNGRDDVLRSLQDSEITETGSQMRDRLLQLRVHVRVNYSGAIRAFVKAHQLCNYKLCLRECQ